MVAEDDNGTRKRDSEIFITIRALRYYQSGFVNFKLIVYCKYWQFNNATHFWPNFIAQQCSLFSGRRRWYPIPWPLSHRDVLWDLPNSAPRPQNSKILLWLNGRTLARVLLISQMKVDREFVGRSNQNFSRYCRGLRGQLLWVTTTNRRQRKLWMKPQNAFFF